MINCGNKLRLRLDVNQRMKEILWLFREICQTGSREGEPVSDMVQARVPVEIKYPLGGA